MRDRRVDLRFRRSVHRLPVAALLLLAVTLTACATTAKPPEPIVEATAKEARRELETRAGSFAGARSYVKLSIRNQDRNRVVNARMAVDRDRNLELRILTPVGTEAATVFLGRAGIMVINAIEKTYWTGTFTELGATIGLGGASLASTDLSSLLAGFLPEGADCDTLDVRDDELTCGSPTFTYVVGRRGLSELVVKGEPEKMLVSFSGGFPPRRIRFQTFDFNSDASPSATLEVEHLEWLEGSKPVAMPVPPKSYRRLESLPTDR